MKGWTRRQFDQLCNHLQNTITGGTFSDQLPTPLLYGQDGEAGSTGLLVHSNHRHALSAAIYGAIPTTVMDLCTVSTSENTNLKVLNNIFGSNTGLVTDSPGVFGSFGMSGINFAVGIVGTNYHIALSNSRAGSGAGDRSDRVHSPQRLSRLIIRARPRVTATPGNGHKALIGGMHETTGGVTPDLDSADDLLGFYISVDVAGAGNFHAMAKSSTTGLTTDIDLGFGWRYSSNGEYMNFKIDYDLTTATFSVDDVAYAEITTNIPTQKFFGWGLFAEQTVGVPSTREIWLDDLIFLGRF